MSATPPQPPGIGAGPRLLVVDDEPEIRELLAEYFGRQGFVVDGAADAAQARERVAQSPPLLVLLDLNMPGENGLEWARWLRKVHPEIGILMLTTAAEVVDRVVGLEVGADDYVPKPFELRELLARVRALQRRLQGNQVQKQVVGGKRVRFGKCWLDLEQHQLLDEAGLPLDITAAEFDVLALLAQHPNRPLTRDQIMASAHNRGWDVFDRSIDLRMMRLRRKIEDHPDKPTVIKTVRNVGYVFNTQ